MPPEFMNDKDINSIDIEKLLKAINEPDDKWVSWTTIPKYNIVSPEERASRATKGIIAKLQEVGKKARPDS